MTVFQKRKEGKYNVFFFKWTKALVHLTHLELPLTYLEIFVWLEHLIKIHLEYNEKKF